MRRNIVTVVVGLGVGAAVAPRPASATCSTGLLQVCASVGVSVSGSAGNWTIALTAFNLFPSQGVSYVMTTLGIGSFSLGDDWARSTTLVNPPAGWTQSALKPSNCVDCFVWQNNAVGAQIDVGGETTNGLNGGIGPGGTLTLSFSSTSALNLADVDDWVAGWHAQAVGGTGCSLWVDTNGTTVGGTSAECTNVVPEPVTLVLLGTGLTSIGGIGLLRRRKRNGDIEST